MKKIDENSYLEAEEADKFRVALGRCVQGKPVHATWVLGAVASDFTREEIEYRLATIGYEVNWARIRCAQMFLSTKSA